MYSWSEDTSDWYGSGSYRYSIAGGEARAAAAAAEAAAGSRTYAHKSAPNPTLIDPHKKIATNSAHPIIVAVDVTGSMANWPSEIFDRLPLLYNTLSQYKEDVEICFAAIGDAGVDRWPLQVTDFAHGYDLEQQLNLLYGEGGGGDAPESYGLFAWWVENHVATPNASHPFLIVFGDAARCTPSPPPAGWQTCWATSRRPRVSSPGSSATPRRGSRRPRMLAPGGGALEHLVPAPAYRPPGRRGGSAVGRGPRAREGLPHRRRAAGRGLCHGAGGPELGALRGLPVQSAARARTRARSRRRGREARPGRKVPASSQCPSCGARIPADAAGRYVNAPSALHPAPLR